MPAAAPEPHALVFTQRGTLPIVLSAPHGGSLPIPGASRRTTGVLLQDMFTAQIAEGVMRRLEKRLGGKPYAVIARFHRAYADVNREEPAAFQSPKAKPHYHAYHRVMREFVDEIRGRGPGLLVDIHGQARDADTLFRGTRNRKTVARLVERHAMDALTAPAGLFGSLQAAGYRIFPAHDAPDAPEERAFGGGFIVATYGSHQRDGIDAVQIEIGSGIRKDPARRERFTRDLSDAIAGLYERYLRAEW